MNPDAGTPLPNVLGVTPADGFTPAALGGIALNLETGAVISWSGLLLTLGLVSSLVAARRVLAIDPIETTTGQGVGSGGSSSPNCAAGPDASPRQR